MLTICQIVDPSLSNLKMLDSKKPGLDRLLEQISMVVMCSYILLGLLRNLSKSSLPPINMCCLTTIELSFECSKGCLQLQPKIDLSPLMNRCFESFT